MLHQLVTKVQDLISKADVLLEALPYLLRFRGKIFVVNVEEAVRIRTGETGASAL